MKIHVLQQNRDVSWSFGAFLSFLGLLLAFDKKDRFLKGYRHGVKENGDKGACEWA